MDAQRSTRKDGRLAALAPAGLAALVAGTLFTFSALAFNTAFDGSSETRKVAVSSPSAVAGGPVVLPTPPDADAGSAASATAPEIDREVRVLGLRIGHSTADAAIDEQREDTKNAQDKKQKQDKEQKDGRSFAPGRSLTSREPSTDSSSTTDTHRHSKGKGHLKARGKGHHKDHSQGHSADSHGRADPHGPSKSHGRSRAKKKD